MATAFVGFSVLSAFLTIFLLVLLFFMKTTTVFHICGWMQILSGKFLYSMLELLIYNYIKFTKFVQNSCGGDNNRGSTKYITNVGYMCEADYDNHYNMRAHFHRKSRQILFKFRADSVWWLPQACNKTTSILLETECVELSTIHTCATAKGWMRDMWLLTARPSHDHVYPFSNNR